MPDTLWPWLAVAGLGALHGLNPAAGWGLAAAFGLRSGDRREAWRALLPLALGHLAAVAVAAAGALAAVRIDSDRLQLMSMACLLAGAAFHFWRRPACVRHAPAGRWALALYAFLASGGHGAGLALVPALAPFCTGSPGGPGDGLAAIGLALAAVGLHSASMLAVAGLLAAGVCRGCEGIGPGLRIAIRSLRARRRAPMR